MARKPTGKPNGSPVKVIDRAMFEGMCKCMCTREEIASIVGLDEDTVTAWCKREYGETFSAVYKKLTDGAKMSLRRAMFKNATIEGNTTMQIWLSKQYLGMKDKELHSEDSDKLEYELVRP